MAARKDVTATWKVLNIFLATAYTVVGLLGAVGALYFINENVKKYKVRHESLTILFCAIWVRFQSKVLAVYHLQPVKLGGLTIFSRGVSWLSRSTLPLPVSVRPGVVCGADHAAP